MLSTLPNVHATVSTFNGINRHVRMRLQLAVGLKETYISYFGNTIRFGYIVTLIQSFYTYSQYKTYLLVSISTLLFFDDNVEGQNQSDFEKETIKGTLKGAVLVVFLAMISVLVGIN